MSQRAEEREAGASRGMRLAKRFLRRSWQALVVVFLALALGVAAFLSPGLVQADVQLDEGTVYPGKRESGLIGILNAQIDELADAMPVGTTNFDILQHEDTVLIHGTASTLVAYNPGRNRPGSVLQLPTNAQVALGGDTLAVTSPDNGRVWFGDVATVFGYDFQTEKAALEIDEFGVSTVTTAGNVISLNVQTSQLVRAGEEEDEVLTVDLPWQINTEAPNVQLSAVGESAVVLDAEAGRIWVEGMTDDFPVSGAAAAQLAAPAPDALGGEARARAIYATQAGLIAVSRDGNNLVSEQMSATPIRPIQVGECVYSAFGNQFVKRCAGEEPQTQEIPDVPAGAELTFHANRSTVILNDMESGVIWLVDKGMLRIEDWDRVNPPVQETTTDEPDVQTEIPPERDARNNPPVAEDDYLAARAGRSTILPVLDNDSDPDGDVLTISVGNTQLDGASLELVRGGAGLQITIDATVTGDLDFQYTISDGRPGGTDSANVTVRVLPADPAADNSAPREHPLAQPLTMQLGTTVTKRVLLDWRDDEGDPMMLVDASLPLDAEDEVSFTPDGEVTFRDIGKTTGTKIVNVVISDGYDTAEGEMVINVVDDTVPPMAFGDFATVRAGDLVTVEPLLNDVGVGMILTDVDPGEDCACLVETNNRESYFTFRSDVPGTYYVTYQVSNPLVAVGLVRIDVLPDEANALPVAALDVALLPPGGSVTIDPLLNDTSPRGDVLVVQSVSQADGLEIVLERRHLVTIRALTRQSEPITLTYWVSDGRNSVPGTIIVMPTSTQGSVEPQAGNDTVRIRAGSTQSVNVLANDVSPVGLDLSLDALVENPFNDRAWIDGDQLRISIASGAGATTSTITYQIRDTEGRISSAQVTVQVVSEDDQNEPPVPRPVTDRVLAGTTTRIAIPMDGIDINGDAVRLLGIGSGPSLGRVLATGDGWLLYEAFPTSQGTDVFRYQVIDALGEIGTEEIRIGVAPAGPTNNAPVGVLDEMTVRPGSPVQIPALRNDVDVDGDSIKYADTDPVQIDGVEHIEVIEGREIAFTAPMEVGEYRGVYHIEDSRGEPGSGNILLRVSETAPLLPPEPRDDLVPVSSVVGRDWVEVDVLANDFDPDGLHEDLRVTVLDETDDETSPRASDDRRGVIVPITEHMQQVRYEAVDGDNLSAPAVITVPGRNDSVPVLNDPDANFTVIAGQPLTLTLSSLVSGTEGRSVRLTSVDNVTATHGVVAPGPERIEYTPSLEYAGPASVVFEVADVVREGDRSGKSAFISIPITVTPADLGGEDGGEDPTAEVLPPPELIGEPPVVQVGPGEGESRRDLRPLIKVHTGGNFYFENFQHVEGDQRIEYRGDANGQIYAWTEIDVQPGTTRIISVEAVDARGASAPITIRLEVVSSRMPLPVAANYDAEALAGQEGMMPVLTESRSNLPDRTGLHLVGEPSVMPAGAGTAAYDGDTVKFYPAEGFVGTMTVSYTIVDDTMDPGRYRDGFIRVTVKDRPSRPGAPRDGQVSSGTITFTYTPGSSNGLEITRRVVIPVRADGTEMGAHECPSTTCTITDLPNGVPYQLKVIESNDAGDSDPSPLSAAYTPDQRPLPPGIRTSGFGDRSLDVEWQEVQWEDAGNPGSPVENFTLFLLSEGGEVINERNVGAGQRSYTWTGLTNGTRYRFAITATNAAGTSDRSGLTDPEYPAAPPGPPPSVSHVPTENELGGAFNVTWNTNVETNGDAVSKYIITPITQSGRGTPREVDPRAGGTQTVSMEGLGQVPYKFEVRAVNKAGPGAPATTPEWKTAWELPKVTSASVDRHGPNALVVSMSTNFDDRPQASPVRQYSTNGRNWSALGEGGVISGLTNGESYNVDVRVVIDDGQRASGSVRAGGTSMPRSDTPAAPGKSSWHTLLRTGSEARISVQEFSNYLDTGGWNPDRYVYSCDIPGWQSCRGSGRQFTVPAPSEATITVTHQDHDSWSTQLDYDVRTPHGGSYDSSTRKLDVVLRYVNDARCTVTVGSFEKEYRQTGGYGTFTFEDTLPEDEVSGSRANVVCNSPNLDQAVSFSVN